MSNYRRWYVPGGTYFFTLVAHRRRPIFTTDLGRDSLRQAIESVRAQWPFEIVAMVLLPEHLHAVWSMPPRDDKYSLRLRKIKERYTRIWLAGGGLEAAVSASRQRKGERGVWQRRFWEHTYRDEEDLKRCVDYVHWNPKKHGLVQRVCDWPYSTFARFVAAGEYDQNWGGDDPCPGWDMPEI